MPRASFSLQAIKAADIRNTQTDSTSRLLQEVRAAVWQYLEQTFISTKYVSVERAIMNKSIILLFIHVKILFRL